jgi:hypothetical protein
VSQDAAAPRAKVRSGILVLFCEKPESLQRRRKKVPLQKRFEKALQKMELSI